MQIFPQSVIKLWNGWEIRVLVLSSLMLQITLIMLGSKRKYIARLWISLIVWLAYLSADWLATVALGVLASSNEDSDDSSSAKPNNLIHAFWAPFLLLHLGGPDTITSYSLEDNELWLRHLLGLMVEVSVAFYVYLRSFSTNALTFLAIPVFIAGIAKYGERTWVLRSSSAENLRESLLSSSSSSSSIGKEWKEKKIVPRGPPPPASTNYFHNAAHYLFRMSMYLLEDLILEFSELMDSYSVISSVSSSEEAFKLVEIELGLIYDLLYTKAPLVYTRLGLILRSISFSFSLVALVVFSVIIDGHPSYATVDIALTYLLLTGAFVLEVYALACLIFSDWTMIWLSKSGNPPTHSISRSVYYLRLHFRSGRRWSGLMGQYDLVSSCLKIGPPKFFKYFGIDEAIKYLEISWKNVNADLKDSIFKHIQEKGNRIMRELQSPASDEEQILFRAQMIRDTILNLQGQSAVRKKNLVEEVEGLMSLPFTYRILAWHIATDLCYYVDMDDHADDSKRGYSEYRMSKILSDYMLHILIMNPNMMVKGNQSIIKSSQDTQDEIKKFLFQGEGRKGSYTEKDACIKIFQANFDKDDMSRSSMLYTGFIIAKELNLKPFEEKWDGIREVWIEMLAYAASHCEWKQHAQQLRRGGELLTHVGILMAHFGLSEQYQAFPNKLPGILPFDSAE